MSFSNFIPVQPNKCQCISLDKHFFITESDNALFPVGPMMGKPVTLLVPFLKKIVRKLKSMHPGDEPLFFQDIRTNLKHFPKVCDFIFTKVQNSDGESIVWFIYDNSHHFSVSRTI